MLETLASKTKRPKRKVGRIGIRLPPTGIESMVARLDSGQCLTDEQLWKFCADNRDLRIEQTAEGELIIMPPASGDAGHQELEVGVDLGLWARGMPGGRAFGPSAGFKLPGGSMRAPDASWISQERLDQLAPGAMARFTPVCPDFVVELRSRTDRLPTLKKKMVEYMENGARLGWLIDPINKQVFIYRPGEPLEHLQAPATLSGESVLPGFTLDLTRVW